LPETILDFLFRKQLFDFNISSFQAFLDILSSFN
jgi:hypothetical protein